MRKCIAFFFFRTFLGVCRRVLFALRLRNVQNVPPCLHRFEGRAGEGFGWEKFLETRGCTVAMQWSGQVQDPLKGSCTDGVIDIKTI